MKKLLLSVFILIISFNISYAQVSFVNLSPSDVYDKRVNSITQEVINNPLNENIIDRYIIALLTRADYYKKSKHNLEKSSDDLRSALYFLSRNKNSDKYQLTVKKLGENLSAMEYYPSNQERIELAKNLYWEGQYFAAAYEFEQLGAIGYDDKTSYEFLGDIYVKINREDKAINCYDKSYRAYPKNGNVSYKLAELYEKNKDDLMADEKYKHTIQYTDDINILNTIINKYNAKLKQDPKNASNYEVLALAYKKEKNYQTTYNLLKQAIMINPDDMTLKYELANVLYEMKEYQEAINTCDLILSKNPYDSQIRITKAKSLSALGRKDDAVKEYQMVLVVYPDSHQAQYGIYRLFYGLPLDTISDKFYPLNADFVPNGDLYVGLGDFAKEIDEMSHAKSFYKQALLKDKKSYRAYISLYDIYELENNKQEALSIIEKGYKNLPSNKEIIEVYENINKDDTTRKKEIALSYFTNNDYRHALTIYSQINPKNSDVFLSMANCHTMLKEYDKANENLQNAIKIDASNSDLYYMLALNYLDQNSPQSAKRELKKSIALNKKNLKSQKLLNSILRNEIGQVLSNAEKYYNKKDYYKALEIINDGIGHLGAQVQLLYYRGKVYQEQKKYLEALSDYKRIIDIDSGYDPVFYVLGTLFEEIGQERDALSAYERYLSGTPESKENAKKAQDRVIELQKKYY